MAKEASEAPKERVNIVYRPATTMDEDVELCDRWHSGNYAH